MPEAGEGRRWRVIDTGPADGAWNLAVDDALFRLAEAGEGPPTIRFYGWSPPALSLGCFQQWEKEIDPGACRKRGVAVYRRITGGRAVYHGPETTYSVVVSRRIEGFSRGLLPAYGKIATALAAGLHALGVEARIASPRRATTGDGRRPHPSCFAATSGYELSVNGKKLVGSAQKRGRRAVLQHGSILHAPHHEELSFLLRHGDAAQAATASLKAALGRRPGHGEVVSALRRGFEKQWGISLVEATLEKHEKDLARRLAAERYRSLA